MKSFYHFRTISFLLFGAGILSCTPPFPEITFHIGISEPFSTQRSGSIADSYPTPIAFLKQGNQLLFSHVLENPYTTYPPIAFDLYNTQTGTLENTFVIDVIKLGLNIKMVNDTTVSPDGTNLLLLCTDNDDSFVVLSFDLQKKTMPSPLVMELPKLKNSYPPTFARSGFLIVFSLEGANDETQLALVDLRVTPLTPSLIQSKRGGALFSRSSSPVLAISTDGLRLLCYNSTSQEAFVFTRKQTNDAFVQQKNKTIPSDAFFTSVQFLYLGTDLIRIEDLSPKHNSITVFDDQLGIRAQSTTPGTFFPQATSSVDLQAIALPASDYFFRLWSIPKQDFTGPWMGGHSHPLRQAEPLGTGEFVTFDEPGNAIGWQESPFAQKPQPTKSVALQRHLLSSLYVSKAIDAKRVIATTSRDGLLFEENRDSLNTFSVMNLGLRKNFDALSKATTKNVVYGVANGKDGNTLYEISTISSESKTDPYHPRRLSQNPMGNIQSVEASPSGGCVVAGDAKGKVVLSCSDDSFTKEILYQDLQSNVTQLAWSPSGEWLVGADDTGHAVLWGLLTDGALQHRLLRGGSPVVGATWVHDQIVALLQQDGTLTLYSAPDGSVLQQSNLGHMYYRASFVTTETGVTGILILQDRFSVQRLSFVH